MMGLYSAMLMGGGALGALQLSPVLTASDGNWQQAPCLVCVAPASVALVAITLSIKKNISETNKLPLNTLIWRRPRTALLIVGFGFC